MYIESASLRLSRWLVTDQSNSVRRHETEKADGRRVAEKAEMLRCVPAIARVEHVGRLNSRLLDLLPRCPTAYSFLEHVLYTTRFLSLRP